MRVIMTSPCDVEPINTVTIIGAKTLARRPPRGVVGPVRGRCWRYAASWPERGLVREACLLLRQARVFGFFLLTLEFAPGRVAHIQSSGLGDCCSRQRLET